MINELIENYGFVKYSCLECKDGDVILPPQKNRLNVLYAIVVDDELVYIGQTVNLRKRINYYRTSINRQTPTADTRKSKNIHKALAEGKTVTFYYRQCFELHIENPTGKDIISTADIEEPVLITKFKPEWNTNYVNKRKQQKSFSIVQKSDGTM